jgi:hypothetical protein
MRAIRGRASLVLAWLTAKWDRRACCRYRAQVAERSVGDATTAEATTWEYIRRHGCPKSADFLFPQIEREFLDLVLELDLLKPLAGGVVIVAGRIACAGTYGAEVFRKIDASSV